MFVLTRGVADLGQEEVNEILKIVKEFNVFTKDNDPWKEHHFGSFNYQGKKFFWKIDDYAGSYLGDPPDEESKYIFPPNLKNSLTLFNLNRVEGEEKEKELILVVLSLF